MLSGARQCIVIGLPLRLMPARRLIASLVQDQQLRAGSCRHKGNQKRGTLAPIGRPTIGNSYEGTCFSCTYYSRVCMKYIRFAAFVDIRFTNITRKCSCTLHLI